MGAPYGALLVYPEKLSTDEKIFVAKIDAFLNFFENVSYLSSKESELLEERDREAGFNYWFDVVMKKESHVILRRYLLQGFDKLCARLEVNPEAVYLAVYGTLMHEQDNPIRQEIRDKMISKGPCQIRGRMYVAGPHGQYPGVTIENVGLDEFVTGELLLLGANDEEANATLRILDGYEEFNPADIPGSEFVRRFVMLKEPRKGAWTYVYNRSPDDLDLKRIPSGNWKQYQESKSAPGDSPVCTPKPN